MYPHRTDHQDNAVFSRIPRRGDKFKKEAKAIETQNPGYDVQKFTTLLYELGQGLLENRFTFRTVMDRMLVMRPKLYRSKIPFIAQIKIKSDSGVHEFEVINTTNSK